MENANKQRTPKGIRKFRKLLKQVAQYTPPKKESAKERPTRESAQS